MNRWALAGAVTWTLLAALVSAQGMPIGGLAVMTVAMLVAGDVFPKDE